MTKKLVVFDMDGTLITGNTWEDFNTALGVTDDEDWALYSAFSKDEITYGEWQQELLKLYRLDENKHTKEQVLSYLTQYELKTDAKACLEQISAAGHDTLLLSGSFQMTAYAVAFELGMDEAIATTTCVFDQEGMLCNFLSEGDEQHAKVKRLEIFCAEKNISLDDCVVIGDGPNDIPLFKLAKHSMTFEEAADEAKAVASHTISSLTELPKLIASL